MDKIKVFDYIVFKIKNNDNEECAKIYRINNNLYEIKQTIDGLTVQGTIKFENIIRKACIKDLELLKGTSLYNIKNPVLKPSVIGFESNLIRHD
tara:strand:+ start:89 stop:370 length:282 start_codon:yes stop_codon:yes gene_type:complete